MLKMVRPHIWSPPFLIIRVFNRISQTNLTTFLMRLLSSFFSIWFVKRLGLNHLELMLYIFVRFEQVHWQLISKYVHQLQRPIFKLWIVNRSQARIGILGHYDVNMRRISGRTIWWYWLSRNSSPVTASNFRWPLSIRWVSSTCYRSVLNRKWDSSCFTLYTSSYKGRLLRKHDFVYDEHYDCYLRPEGQVLQYSTTTKEGYRQYFSNPI